MMYMNTFPFSICSFGLFLTLTFADSSEVPEYVEEESEGLECQGEDLAEHFSFPLAS